MLEGVELLRVGEGGAAESVERWVSTSCIYGVSSS